MSADIYIENLTDNSLEQVYENSAPIDNYVDNNITSAWIKTLQSPQIVTYERNK